jgi:DnaJ-class molecular chaperone
MPRFLPCHACDGKREVLVECDECVLGDGCGRRHEWEPCETCGGEGELDCSSDECEVCDDAADDTAARMVGQLSGVGV